VDGALTSHSEINTPTAPDCGPTQRQLTFVGHQPDSNPIAPRARWTPAAASSTVRHLMAAKRRYTNRTLVPAAAAGMRAFAVGGPSTSTLIDQPRGH
jgi:hypothetical protein